MYDSTERKLLKQIHNIQHKDNSKIDFTILEKIQQLNLIIASNGKDKFLGISYIHQNHYYLEFKCSSQLSYFYLRIAQQIGISCIENIPLTNTIYNELRTGGIPTDYYEGITIPFKPWEFLDFQLSLKQNLSPKVNILIKTHYKRITKKYLITFESIDDKTDKVIKLELQKLAEQYNLSFSEVYNSQTETDEYYLKSSIEEYDIKFWKILFVQKKTKKIFVAAYGIFEYFDLNKAGSAIGLIKVLVDADQKSLKHHVQKYYEEFFINERLFEIAISSVKTILNLNFSRTGMEYFFYRSRTTVMTIYLKKSYAKVFVIDISCNEFIRNPAFFRKFIENPYKMNRWNFRCHERKTMPKSFYD